MIEETPWLWSKGLAALCDHRIPDDFSDGLYSAHEDSVIYSQESYYESVADSVSSGELLWVKGEWLSYFVSKILPNINKRFVLVTGDSDISLPAEKPAESSAILESPHVLHWYTQNYDGTPSGKISPLPIGMDFHTIQRQDAWMIKKLSVRKQHEVLEMISSRLKPMAKREKKLYIDSEFVRRADEKVSGSSNDLSRSELYRLLSFDSSVYKQGRSLPQFEMWKRRGEFTFVLSHHGHGLDCHRSWEALVLGHVLVVQKSSLDSLYKDLPVIIIDDWNEIKENTLDKILHINFAKKYKREKLTSRYWIQNMRDTAEKSLKSG